MIDQLIEIDTNVFLWLNSSHTSFWDIFMKMASGKIIWAFMYLALIFAIWRAWGWRTTVVMVVASALVVLFADQVSSSLLRPLFERLRPAHPENPISPMVHIVDGYRAGRYGFPSSHAANTFAIATFMSLLFKRTKFTFFMFFWALLNCYSRIYLGVHYPGDLLFGIVIGSLIGWIVYLVSVIVIRNWKGCVEPGPHAKVYRANVGGIKFRYRPTDVPILIEIMTILAMVLCAVSIFF